MNNGARRIAQVPIETKPEWFTVTTVDQLKNEAVYEDVTDYSLGGGFLGMKFKDGSTSYVSVELHKIMDIEVETHE